MNEYEMVVLLHPDLEIDLEKPLKKVEKIVKDNGGKITKSDNWGKRKLAYPIKKQDHAVYVYYEIQLEPTAVTKVEGVLNITDEVIRYLIAKPTPFEEEEEKSDDKEEKTSKSKDDDKSEEQDDKSEE